RSLADVGRVRLPLVDVTGWKLQPLPVAVAVADRRIFLAEALAAQPLLNRVRTFLLRWPDVLEVNRRAVLVVPQRIAVEVVADLAGQRISDDERRTHQIIRAHINIHATLKIPIAAQHRNSNQAMLANAVRNVRRQRARVADTRG